MANRYMVYTFNLVRRPCVRADEGTLAPRGLALGPSTHSKSGSRKARISETQTVAAAVAQRGPDRREHATMLRWPAQREVARWDRGLEETPTFVRQG